MDEIMILKLNPTLIRQLVNREEQGKLIAQTSGSSMLTNQIIG